jgi:uncharacterized cupredoxin-like copper-binding protein
VPTKIWIAATALVLAAVALLGAGCGGSSESGESNGTDESQPATTGSANAAQMEIKMGDYFFKPANGSADAGLTTISAPNEGTVEHELVLFRTNTDPAKLPTEKDGSVNEEKLDKVAEEGGEIADVEAGETKSETFNLKPGKYVIFCNLPGHYAAGMYGSLTVK